MSETIKSTATDVKDEVKAKTKRFRPSLPKRPTKSTLKTIAITAGITVLGVVTLQSKSGKTVTVNASTSDIVDDEDNTSN